MSGWDTQAVASSYQHVEPQHDDELGAEAMFDGYGGSSTNTLTTNTRSDMEVTEAQAKFRQFLRSFREEEHFVYRDQLVANYQQHAYFVVVDAADMEKFDAVLLDLLRKRPAKFMPVFELAAREVAALNIVPRVRAEELLECQIQLKNYRRFTEIRDLQADEVSTLVAIRGIVVSAAKGRVKATTLSLMCRGCQSTKIIHCGAGFDGGRLPRRCDAPRENKMRDCPVDPYIILADSSSYIDQQRLKLQESPETVPTGEMPRHLSLSLERYLVGTVKPGTRVTVTGIYTIFQAKATGRENTTQGAVAIRSPYLRVLGISRDNEASDLLAGKFRQHDEEQLHELAKTPDLYDKIANSIAPAIFGSADIKKAIACQLFGGSRKLLPDGMRLRGDINILLLGDPSTAKSQFLKFAIQVAPIGVYTSGKGSSAAGLTASVIRDPSSGEFQLEGGALVLADGGLVCIDEFDKMRTQDRVAIHEAMEQQTISIAKAGITTILNSRTSVLAAANPIFGRYDDMKNPLDNIDFQATILSRFDLIFIVKDVRDEKRDQQLAKYVVNVHQNLDAAAAHQNQRTGGDDEKSREAGELDIEILKKYIAFARSRCFPRLSEEAAETLKNHYVKIRSTMRKREKEYGRAAIPITVRQLEAIVRLSEALARMELSPVATTQHVEEAIRLFRVSTFQAATSASGSSEVFGSSEFWEQVKKAENHIRRRVAINSRVSKRTLTFEMERAKFDSNAIEKAIEVMVSRHEMRYERQQKDLMRMH